jgi:L-ascorbate metabolism protein UlaG (beta-lactamase superfamily)
MKPSAIVKVVLALAMLLSSASAVLAQGKTRLLWLGQASWRIETPGGKVIVIDPWLTAGPKAPAEYKDLAKLGKVDLLLVTHAHPDHIGDAPAIAKMYKTKLYGPADMVTPLILLGVLPAELSARINKTGRATPLEGITITAVKAEHSSIYVFNNPATSKPEAHPAGEAMGYIIQMENGFKIWHMGDTGLFPDMQFIFEHYKPDLVLMPIGGTLTMDPADAAYAARTWVKASNVIPMHYGANPIAYGKPQDFVDAMKGSPTKVTVMTEGQTVEF